jgi:GAF domain-containing protein
MFTTGIAWLALTAGITLAVLALGARSARTLRRLRDAALVLTAASAAIGLVIWGTPEGSTLAPARDLGMMALAAAILGILVLFLATGRKQQHVVLLGETAEAQARLLDSVATAIGREPSLNRMLMGVASALRAATGATSAVVYKLDASGGTPVLVGSAAPTGSKNIAAHALDLPSLLASEYAIGGCVSEYRPDSECGRRLNRAAWGIVPLTSGRKVLAAVLLQEPTISITTPPSIETITKVASLAGRALSDWIGAARGESSNRLAQNLYRLSVDLLDEKSLERSLPVIARALNGIVPVDYLSISWLNRAHFHEDRASMIIGQRRVVENRRKWPIWDGTTSRLLGMARPLITPDLLQAPDESPVGGAWESRLGLRSRIVVPIRDGERLLGSLTLAHREVARYGLDESGPLIAIASGVGLWLKQLEAVRISRRYCEVTLLANQWDHDSVRTRTDQELLKEAHRAIRTSALRLYRITADGQAMEGVAVAGRTHNGPKAPARIPLVETPWHRWSLEDSTPRRIDQSDPESLMEQTEAELAMIPRMKTGWIVPITCGGRTIGFVDAMETRDPDRQSLDEPERLLLGTLARAFARRWAGALESEIPPAGAQKWQERVSDFNHSIINPLTGIIGSVELIRHKQPVLTDESIKYLNIIERSANKIHSSALQSLRTDRGNTEDSAGNGTTEQPFSRFSGVLAGVTTDPPENSVNRFRHWRVERPAGVTMAE